MVKKSQILVNVVCERPPNLHIKVRLGLKSVEVATVKFHVYSFFGVFLCIKIHNFWTFFFIFLNNVHRRRVKAQICAHFIPSKIWYGVMIIKTHARKRYIIFCLSHFEFRKNVVQLDFSSPLSRSLFQSLDFLSKFRVRANRLLSNY